MGRFLGSGGEFSLSRFEDVSSVVCVVLSSLFFC